MLLVDAFPKSKIKNADVANKYSVVDFVQGMTTNQYVKMSCSDCHHSFEQRPSRVLCEGIISCKCSKSYRRTPDELVKDAIEFTENTYMKFVSVDYTKPLSNSTLHLKCLKCENHFDKSFQNLYYNNSGCPHCSGKYQPTVDEYFTKIQARLGVQFKLTTELVENTSKNSLIEVECLLCNRSSSKTIAAVIYQKPSCPHCAVYGYDESTPGYMYLIKLFNETSEYYKIGVTGNLKRRFAELSYHNDLSLEVLNTWEYNSHEPILKHENFLKDNFALGRLVDKPFEHGYTEIVCKEHLPVILTLQNLQYRNMRSGFSS
jgi:ribosomal protein L44E